ncbi:MAG: hypothetical protein J0I48_22375, partial [Devosia sp.]|nr:hypothetical protein [Devosia sp.]
YNETLDITTDNLTLIGDGVVEINGTFSEDNAAFATSGESLAEWLKTTGGYTSGADPAVRIAADNVTLHNLTIKDSTWGVELAEGADGAALRHVDLVSNVYGIYKQADSDISGLVLEDGSISDGYVGINFDKAVSGGGASGVTIDGTHFEHLLRKGIYVETLSDALLTNITMEDVGQFGATTFNGPAGAGGNGINLNLKYGNYSNIQITHFTLNNVGASDRDGLDLVGHPNGGAIVIAARDDGSYAGDPATLSNVTVANGQITGTTSTAIHVGEPGRDNAGPAVTVNNVTITAITELSADHGAIANETQATMLVTGTFGDDRMIASGDSDGAFGLFGQFGNDTLGGGSKNDTLDGGLGIDTAVYSSSLTTGDVAFGGSNWTLDGGSEGLDTLISIERISHGGSGDILLVGGGGYANRAAAEAQKGVADVLLFASTPGAVFDTDGAGNTVDEQAATGTIVGIDAEASTDSAGGSITYSLADDA